MGSVPQPAKQDLQRSIADSQPKSPSWRLLSFLSLNIELKKFPFPRGYY